MNNEKLLTTTGINFPKNMSENEFFEAGKFLAKIETGMQWAAGDWFNAIPWGDKEAACKKAGLNYHTARKYGLVSATFQTETRVSGLGFNHHRLLMHSGLSDSQRAELLRKAELKEWKAPMLKQERNKILGIENKPTIHGFDELVGELVHKVEEAMPKTATKKLSATISKGVLNIAEDLKGDFQKHLNKAIEPMRFELAQKKRELEAERKRVIAMQTSINAFMTRDEFKLIRACLHPDKHNGEAKYARAFDIFNRLEDAVPKNLTDKVKQAQGWD